jgi:TRAP-type C4-dicarboxylate transport system permease small subunit
MLPLGGPGRCNRDIDSIILVGGLRDVILVQEELGRVLSVMMVLLCVAMCAMCVRNACVCLLVLALNFEGHAQLRVRGE